MRRKHARKSYRPRTVLPPPPKDERGLPLIPEWVTGECNPEECHYKKPFKDRHHVEWPDYEYTTPVERRFKTLGALVLTMCRCEHQQWHRSYSFPKKLSPNLMYQVIDEVNRGTYQLRQEGQQHE
jgi:hypothetical protein